MGHRGGPGWLRIVYARGRRVELHIQTLVSIDSLGLTSTRWKQAGTFVQTSREAMGAEV